MSGVSPAGRFSYVRTAAMASAPGTVLGARSAQWLAPAATFVLASAPGAAAAATSALDTNSVYKPHSMLATCLGVGGLVAGSIAASRAYMSNGREPSNCSSFISGTFGVATSSLAIVVGLHESTASDAGFAVQVGIVGAVFAAAAWALYLHANRTKHDS